RGWLDLNASKCSRSKVGLAGIASALCGTKRATRSTTPSNFTANNDIASCSVHSLAATRIGTNPNLTAATTYCTSQRGTPRPIRQKISQKPSPYGLVARAGGDDTEIGRRFESWSTSIGL